MRILVPIDGSEVALRALDHLIAKRAWYGAQPDVHLVNVQPPLPNDVSRFIAAEDIKGHHHDAGMQALAGARARLDAAGIRHALHISVGEPGHVIAHFAKDLGCDQIVMASHGQGASADLLGSVARRVIHLASIPVLLIK